MKKEFTIPQIKVNLFGVEKIMLAASNLNAEEKASMNIQAYLKQHYTNVEQEMTVVLDWKTK